MLRSITTDVFIANAFSTFAQENQFCFRPSDNRANRDNRSRRLSRLSRLSPAALLTTNFLERERDCFLSSSPSDNRDNRDNRFPLAADRLGSSKGEARALWRILFRELNPSSRPPHSFSGVIQRPFYVCYFCCDNPSVNLLRPRHHPRRQFRLKRLGTGIILKRQLGAMVVNDFETTCAARVIVGSSRRCPPVRQECPREPRPIFLELEDEGRRLPCRAAADVLKHPRQSNECRTNQNHFCVARLRSR